VASKAGGATTNTVAVSVLPPGAGGWIAGESVAYAVNLGPGVTYTVTDLPAGLTFNPSRGLISGTPSVAGTNEVTIVGRTRTVTTTNRILFPVRLGRPEIVGSDRLEFTGSASLLRGQPFRYQISARLAGQPWAGASDFTGSWNLLWTNAIGSRGTLTATSGSLRYLSTLSNVAYASLDWSRPLPLDTPWQVSVNAAFSASNLAGYLQNQEYLTAMLLALRDRSTASGNYRAIYLEGSTSAPTGEVVARAVSEGVTNGDDIGPGTSGKTVLSLAYRPTDLSLVSRAELEDAGPPWVNLQTNSVSSWTNQSGGGSVILRLMGQSMASPHQSAPFPYFTRFVVSPSEGLSYQSSNLPHGLTLDGKIGLISGTPTVQTNLQNCLISISNGRESTNLIIKFSVQ